MNADQEKDQFTGLDMRKLNDTEKFTSQVLYLDNFQRKVKHQNTENAKDTFTCVPPNYLNFR